ncbi:hypothetical protein HY486_02800 [Candidatus Woesearchaeota archaeon]|nr:hypothetical protein [Candidatus Woesearchaeota archaeon]
MSRKREHSHNHSNFLMIVLVILVVAIFLWYSSSSIIGDVVLLAPSSVIINSKIPVLQDSVIAFTVSPPTSSIYVFYKNVYLYSEDHPETNGWRQITVSPERNPPHKSWAFIIPNRGIATLSGSLFMPLSIASGSYRLYFFMREWNGNSWSSLQWVRKDITVISKNYCPVSEASECQGSTLRSCTNQHEWVQNNCDNGCYQETSTKAYCKQCNEGEQRCSDSTELTVCTNYQWRSRYCDIACDNNACIEIPSGNESSDEVFVDSVADEELPQQVSEKLCDGYEFEKTILSNISAVLPGARSNDADFLYVTKKGNIRFFNHGGSDYKDGSAYGAYGMVLLSPEGAFIRNVSRGLFGFSPDGKVYFLEARFTDLNFKKGVIQYSEELERVGVPWLISFPVIGNPILPAIVDSAKRIYMTSQLSPEKPSGMGIYSSTGYNDLPNQHGSFRTKTIYPVNNMVYGVASQQYSKYHNYRNTLYVLNEKYLDASIPPYQKEQFVSYIPLNLSYIDGSPLKPSPEQRPIASLKFWADYLFYLNNFGIKVFSKDGESVKEFLINPNYDDPATGISNTSVLYNAYDIAFDSDSNLYTLSLNTNPPVGPVIRKYTCKIDSP